MEREQVAPKRRLSDVDRDDSTPSSTQEPPAVRRRIEEGRSDEVHADTSEPEDSRSIRPPINDTQTALRQITQTQGKPPMEAPKGSEFFLRLPDVQAAKPRTVPFQQPSQLTTFSYSPDHVQEFTNSALRYYVDPPIGSNLSYGYERWIRAPDTRGRIDSLLKAVSKVQSDAQAHGGLPEIGLISWRGVMSKILLAPYEKFEGWELNVMMVNRTIYLEEHLSDEKLSKKNNMDERQRSQTYYGYAFESYCTSDTPPGQRQAQRTSPGVPPGWSGDVNTNVQWCSVVRTKLGDTRMIIGGEVDCVRGKYTGQTDTFVELKTSLAIRGQHDETKFERKLLKFYIQSFLLGVPEIVVGFRTPAGVITTVQSFKTIQLPRMVRGKPGAWDPLVCLDWGNEFVTSLKNVIRQAGSGEDAMTAVWRVKFTPGSGMNVNRLDAAGIEDVVNGEDRVGFLPRWYWDEIRRERQKGPTLSAETMDKKATPMPPLANVGWQI
ncbi:RAI1-domain-containing protein [Agrocybe pediades]|nr:RAI1-domain-containing protein [Agrocybe pediades]